MLKGLRITQIAFFIGASLFVLVSLFLWKPSLFGVCFVSSYGTGNCVAPISYEIRNSLLPISLSFFAAILIMLAANARTFKRWVIFSIGYGVLTLAALLILPQIKLNGGFITFDLFLPEAVAETLSYIYVALSGILFLISQHLPRPK